MQRLQLNGGLANLSFFSKSPSACLPVHAFSENGFFLSVSV